MSRRELGPAVVPLLALAVFIAYIDRGNLATAAPLVKDELRLTGTQLGTLLSSFYWTYVPGQILAASFAERWTVYRVLALGAALWSLATAASGLATGFAALLVLRLVVGLAESAAYPCSAKLLARHLPGQKLGSANALISLGPALGPAFGTYVGGQVMARFGWRATFFVFGLLSALWLVPWRFATGQAPGEERALEATREEGDAPSYAALLKRREMWGTCLGHFCFTYGVHFVIYWLPIYLVKARGFSVVQMATTGACLYLVNAGASLLTGFTCDRLMRAGAGATAVRRAALIGGCVLMASGLVAVAYGDTAFAIAGFAGTSVAHGVMAPNVFATGQTLAGPLAGGKWMGVQNSIGNMAGVVGPIATGYLVDRTGSFVWAFVVASAIASIGIIGWSVMVRRIAPLEWSARRAAIGVARPTSGSSTA
jgi:MFS family permease